MGFLSVVLWTIGILVVLAIIVRLFSGSNKSENIFSRGSSVSQKFADCCRRGLKKVFGGGA